MSAFHPKPTVRYRPIADIACYAADMDVFDSMLDEALRAWPERLTLRIRRLSGSRHIVIGLTDLFERVSTSSDSILVHMHWAVTTAVHEAAGSWPDHDLVVAPRNLDRGRVKAKFESDLRSILANRDEHGFHADDIASFESYLSRNTEPKSRSSSRVG